MHETSPPVLDQNSTAIASSTWFLKTKHLLFVLLLFVSLAFLGYLSSLAIVEIDLDSATDSQLEVFWSNEYTPFSANKFKVTSTKKGRHSYWFIINDFKKSTYLRVDPATEKTNIKIHSIKLYTIQHFPFNINLFNHSMGIKNIEKKTLSTLSASYSEFETLSEDPQIRIRPLQEKAPIFAILFLVLTTALLFPKKYYFQGFLFFSVALALYFCLNFNETTVSFRVQAEKTGQIKVFWRDKNELFSNTRVRSMPIKSGTNTYQVKTGNIGNIEVLYLEPGRNKDFFVIDEIQIKALGFKDFHLTTTESVIDKQSSSATLLISVTLFLFACIFLFWGIFYYPKNKKYFYSKFFPKLIRVLFLLASFLVVNLAWQSDFNIHPDENAHIASIKYFSQYWNPPKVGDSRSLDSYQSPWAISRLDDLGISYFFAGKFRNIVQTLFTNDTFTARAFNVFLFMLFFVLSRDKRLLLFLTPLLCTPQIWYLYSYANRGGFVLFVSILLAWQLVNTKSSLNIFLKGDKPISNWKYSLYPGLLLGILSIEQTNYALFILFIFSALLWKCLFFIKNKKIFIYKCFVFMMIGASFFLARYSLDVSINGFNRQEQRTTYAEQNASANFKPSIAETKESYSGLRLKAKGVSFSELFQPKWDWHKMTFKSFVGFYGYYAEYSPKWYYSYFLLIFGIVILVLFKHAITKENWRFNLFSLLSLTAISGGIFMGLLFSWLHDFQPQGRYIFPIIPILLVYFWMIFPRMKRVDKSILLTSVMVLTLLSFYSFNEVALNYLVS